MERAVAAGTIVEEGRLRATQEALRQWGGKRTEPWHGAMEATLFSAWIYDTLKPFAAELQMGVYGELPNLALSAVVLSC